MEIDSFFASCPEEREEEKKSPKDSRDISDR